ncbi:MAG: hypothetical protein HY645_05935 [Acidobacteria bacterium]|nr:hypothetical protein [Acidobacteriota bacterium]
MRLKQLLLLFGMASLGLSLWAQSGANTVAGTLVDLKCYKAGGFKGNEHMGMAECGMMCAKSGIPVALLDSKGNVSTILAPAPSLAPHVGQQARVTGKFDEKSRSVIPEKVEIKQGSGWQEVKIQSTM